MSYKFNPFTGTFDNVGSSSGSAGSEGYWGSFWSTQDQTAAATGTEYLITLNNSDSNNNGVSIVSNSRMTFAYAGTYSITFSVQWVNTHNQIADGNIWFKKNGANIDDSDSKWSVVESHGGTDGHAIGTVNLVLKLNAGDYIELAWSVTDTHLSLQYESASSPAPSIPSVILTATQVANVLAGSGGTSSLTEYLNSDKPSPSAGDVWVKHTTAAGGGEPIGLLLALTQAGSGTEMYELSYRTSAGTTKRVELT